MKHMQRIFLFIIVLVFLVACSEEEQISPNERYDEFATHWTRLEYEQMYEMYISETKENLTTDASIERYQKIYEDLNIENIQVSFTELSNEEIDTLKEEEEPTANLPFSVEMDSIAGSFEFQYEATLVQEAISNEEDAELS